MPQEHLLAIRPDGEVAFVYEDALRAILDAGDFAIRRASHVEPTTDGRWQADLGPVGGPRLPPVASRAMALEQELRWIEAQILAGPRIPA